MMLSVGGVWSRREILGGLLGTAALPSPAVKTTTWEDVRALFALDPGYVHLGALLISAHPRPVREAIEKHRRGFDENPVQYLAKNYRKQRARVLDAAARYFGADPEAIALTDSTTMGLGLLYNGLRLGRGDEVLTTVHDYYSTRESLRYAAERSGATVREIRLFEDLRQVDAAGIVAALADAIGEKTRVLALTWVHSDTGLALPLPSIAALVAEVNRTRKPEDRLLLCVDGVHGFGVFDVELKDLGCDFFAAGAHKWIFGPRGTGLLYAARKEDLSELQAVVPPFGGKPTPGLAMTPGGFHSFEHRWALAEAFELQLTIGKERIEERTRALATRLKEGLAENEEVRLHTPLDPALSAGIVCFDVEGKHPVRILEALLDAGICGTRAPYGTRAVRLTPSLLNTEDEIDRTLEVICSLT